MGARFLALHQVAEELATSRAQAYALVRTGELPAVKLGGRGQWRVERDRLEEYVQRLYAETRAFAERHLFPAPDGSEGYGHIDDPGDVGGGHASGP